MPDKQETELRFPVRFTFVQRKLIAGVFAEFSERLKLDEPNQRLVSFSLDEMRAIQEGIRLAIQASRFRDEEVKLT